MSKEKTDFTVKTSNKTVLIEKTNNEKQQERMKMLANLQKKKRKE